ncbi:nuclease-related domain-containing protein [Solibacillus sp. CAU 1738]|uniref:nuclease-related domain-containing protein n=1 Tax=Solibacillus sp. CAU 1738 TaxID=3140363 RepID=UPI0032612CD5
MTFWLILIGIVLIGVTAVAIYKYDDSEFSKVTDYSFLDMWTNKKVHAAYKLMTTLDHVKGEHKVLLDLQVPNRNSSEFIDALLIHESGLFIINVEYKKGWISGREQDVEWTQLLHNDKREFFRNPIHNGQRSMYALREQLPEISADAYKTLVLFTDVCSFQKIELHSKQVDVIKTKDLKRWLTNIDTNILSPTEIQTIYDTLKGMSKLKKHNQKSVTTQPTTN